MKFRIFSLMVFILLANACKSNKKTTQFVDLVPVDEIAQIEETPVIEEVPLVMEDSSEENVVVRTESVTPVDKSEIETLYGFYVIIGSFRQVANARQYNEDLVSKGFSPEILVSENGLFRISVGGYNSESAARAQIAEIRAKYREHRDVWLLARK